MRNTLTFVLEGYVGSIEVALKHWHQVSLLALRILQHVIGLELSLGSLNCAVHVSPPPAAIFPVTKCLFAACKHCARIWNHYRYEDPTCASDARPNLAWDARNRMISIMKVSQLLSNIISMKPLSSNAGLFDDRFHTYKFAQVLKM